MIDDYGVTLDDYIYYTNGQNTFLYIKSVLLSFFDDQIDPSKLKTNLNVLPVVYEIFLFLIFKILNIADFKDIYLTSHKL